MYGETEDKCAHAGSLSPENLSSAFKLIEQQNLHPSFVFQADIEKIEAQLKEYIPKDLGRMFDMDFEELE